MARLDRFRRERASFEHSEHAHPGDAARRSIVTGDEPKAVRITLMEIASFHRLPQGSGPRRLPRDYSRDLRQAKWGSAAIVLSSKSQRRTSPVGQRGSFDDPRVTSAYPPMAPDKWTCQNFSYEPERYPPTHPTASAVFYCDNHFNFDGCVARQFGHANRRTRVATALTEEIGKKVRGGVDHLRLLVESRSRSNEASYF